MMDINRRLEELGIEPIGPGFVPATPSEIAEIERRLGHALPQEYRRYLETYGYARFKGAASLALPDSSIEVPVVVFFGGGSRGRAVLEEFEHNEEKFQRGMLPIAADLFGNLFVLHVTGSPPGRVWYANFNRQVPAPKFPDPVGEWYFEGVLAADTFEDFLNRIVTEED